MSPDCGRNQAPTGLGTVTQHQRFCCGGLLDWGAWRGGFARLEFVAQDENIVRSFDADSHLVSRDFYDGDHDRIAEPDTLRFFAGEYEHHNLRVLSTGSVSMYTKMPGDSQALLISCVFRP